MVPHSRSNDSRISTNIRRRIHWCITSFQHQSNSIFFLNHKILFISKLERDPQFYYFLCFAFKISDVSFVSQSRSSRNSLNDGIWIWHTAPSSCAWNISRLPYWRNETTEIHRDIRPISCNLRKYKLLNFGSQTVQRRYRSPHLPTFKSMNASIISKISHFSDENGWRNSRDSMKRVKTRKCKPLVLWVL